MIDRYLLRYFLAVIDHGNFTRAAEHCNVTQPTLSVGIAKLERLVGCALLKRSNRRVDLTETGAQFAVHARQIEEKFNLAEQSVNRDVTLKQFRIGILNTMPQDMVGKIAARLTLSRYNQIELIEGRERDILERLRSARIDIALSIIRPEQKRYDTIPMFTEGYSLALPESHPLARQSVIEAESLSGNVMIVRRQCEILSETSQHFTKRGVRPFFAARTMNDDRALAYVGAGLGITVMPDCFCGTGIMRVPLAEFNYARTIGLLHDNKHDLAEEINGYLSEIFIELT